MKETIDRYFPRNGPCVFHPTRYARHRIIDAIKSQHRLGVTFAELSDDYNMPVEAIVAAVDSSPDDNRMTPTEMKDSKYRRKHGLEKNT